MINKSDLECQEFLLTFFFCCKGTYKLFNFGGGVFHPVLIRVDKIVDEKLSQISIIRNLVKHGIEEFLNEN